MRCLLNFHFVFADLFVSITITCLQMPLQYRYDPKYQQHQHVCCLHVIRSISEPEYKHNKWQLSSQGQVLRVTSFFLSAFLDALVAQNQLSSLL